MMLVSDTQSTHRDCLILIIQQVVRRVKSQSTLSRIVKDTFSGYSSEKDAEDIESFFKVG